MLLCRRILSVCLAVLMIAPFASAQEHVIGRAALDKMIQDRLNREQADRDVILSLLERPDVRNIEDVLAQLVAGRPLELPVGTVAAVRKLDRACGPVRDG